jgi:hypothetical protein
VIKWFAHYAIGDTFVETTGTASVNGLEDPFGQVAGGLLLLGWSALFAIIGAVVMQTRDVTD